MAESSNLMLQAREILATPNHDGLVNVLDRLTMRQETAIALYDFCVANFANCLTLKLLQVYRSSSNAIARFQSICLLSETFAELRNCRFKLNLVALQEIKPLLISCLTMQETQVSDIVTLRVIVSFVADNVLNLDNGGWDELSDCILELANSEPIKAFLVFNDLPPVYGRFISRFVKKILEEAEKVLDNLEEDNVDDWSLGLVTVVKMGIQLLELEVGSELIKNFLDVLVNSATGLVEIGMEQFLLQALEYLERFLSRDMNLYHYSDKQCQFVLNFMFRISKLGTHTKEAAMKISGMAQSSHNQAIKFMQPQEKPLEREWSDHLNTLSPAKILRIFASNVVAEGYRDMAIRRLNVLLADHTSGKVKIDVSVMRELQPLLISWLKEDGVSDSMFKVLGEVVYHVANEILSCQEDKWYELRDYIVSKSKTEFQRAVYIFQCLTMSLENEHFVIPVMKSLLPEISTRLNPPRELLVDNSYWVLTFVGAFCAAIHVVDIKSYAESVKVIEDKMIDSVRELVERGMEVGLVRRAFRDVESIVKKQKEWFGKSQYKFVKGLLRRLCEIEGMKMESRMVLWRINVFVERGVAKLAKELPERVK
ncbi:hypothetical protein EUTSA_v10027695mg [Eutrema salsugineum]|uniref:DUF577 domain-containing protein n=1 Tax=Eutrema salsugineum TaxID=72664 RepID=V4LTZ7_EUTSA|nr:uncharacterized protein LOC18022426 [Eutrema salsugineum]ESQ47304.1 hypothetical protein EUTSA_v10027695mg [Eutrema salsugineum]